MDAAQQRLFDDPELAPWEHDSQRQWLARVVFAEWDGYFDYRIPDRLRPDVEPGRRVRVPFGHSRRAMVGYCVETAYRIPPEGVALRPIWAVVDTHPLLTATMLEVTRWMADYYLCTWGQALEAAVPAGVRAHAGTRQMLVLTAPENLAEQLPSLKLSTQQRRALEHVLAAGQPMTARELAAAVGCSLAPIDALRKRGLLIEQRQRRPTFYPVQQAPQRQAPWQLNAQQQQALQRLLPAIEAGVAETFLLQGVTGSGKTEVYIQAIERVVQLGRQAIVLVPEISLTPQTEERFRSRFAQVAVLHSHQTDVERHAYWREIYQGRVDVVVGARSAIFAPVPRLGLVVIDEEHDASFKQDKTPRYHACQVAQYRCRLEGAPLLLGSATPSLESYHAARSGTYHHLVLTHRIQERPLPPVTLVDMRDETHRRLSTGAISRPLHQAMREALEQDGQVILLLNRRGFATAIQCLACGHVVHCPQCDIALTHHRVGVLAVCHYCGHEEAAPQCCPKCGSETIRLRGQGTQRLEAEVQARFPTVGCVRMDSDSMKKPGAHAAALDRFRRGEAKVLLGTQMIAKGLDFPSVTLVGVVNADTALHLPNFRAAERTFQLVTQVAGRTGRGLRGGHVIVQTYSSDHPAMLAAARHDYDAFARQELAARQRFHYPPFGKMIRVIIRGEKERTAHAFADELARFFQQRWSSPSARLVGPAPTPIPRLQGKYRFHMLLVTPSDLEPLRAVVRQAQRELPTPAGIQWIADVDPLDML